MFLRVLAVLRFVAKGNPLAATPAGDGPLGRQDGQTIQPGPVLCVYRWGASRELPRPSQTRVLGVYGGDTIRKGEHAILRCRTRSLQHRDKVLLLLPNPL